MTTKLYDIIVAKKGAEGKTFWRTIGTIFGDDTTKIGKANGKPVTFSIDFPDASGIIVARKVKKNESENDSAADDNPLPDNPDNY